MKELKQFSSIIVDECIEDYVWALTHTYVGRVGSSSQYSRTDFFANEAAMYIPAMFQTFNDRMASAFIQTIQNSELLKSRVRRSSKLKRLRNLAMILDEKISETFEDRELIGLLVDESKEEEFFDRIKA